MIIIRKRKIIYLICSITLSIFFYSSHFSYGTSSNTFSTFSQQKSVNLQDKNYINTQNNNILAFTNSTITKETASIPINNKVIILDAGHGFPDGGATIKNNSTTESEINLKIVLKLQKLLEGSGCTCLLTRSDENGIYDESITSIKDMKIEDMKNRAKIGNTSNADIFISIHMNKLADTKCYGWQTFYKNKDILSKELADNIQKNLDDLLNPNRKRQIKSISNIYLTKHVTIPLVIVECGFMSNELELHKLTQDEYQNKLAFAIYSGILNYFN